MLEEIEKDIEALLSEIPMAEQLCTIKGLKIYSWHRRFKTVCTWTSGITEGWHKLSRKYVWKAKRTTYSFETWRLSLAKITLSRDSSARLE
ncbi:MAG: hypothetical protein K0Q73_5570 [Paenibacillus sp.]|jgi:hypothetical protein|nr:hypothetical protein [Paenibacillus sp.]